MALSKKNKRRLMSKPINAVPQRQIPIENMSGEELAALVGQQYKLLMQCKNNLATIDTVLKQRKIQLAKMEKDKE